MTAPTPKGESDEKPETDLAATVTPKPGDTVRLRLDYVGEVDEDGDVRVTVPAGTSILPSSLYLPVSRPDEVPDCWTVEVITPPMDEPTTLGTVVVDTEGDKAVYVGEGRWQVVGYEGGFRWAELAQPMRLATEEERASGRIATQTGGE